MTVHDRALHEKLPSLTRPSPLGVRDLALEVAKTGLSGPGPAARAIAAQAEDAACPSKILLQLIEMAVHQVGTATEAKGLTVDALAKPEGQAQARRALQVFAESIGTTPRDLINLLERWAGVLGPVGLPNGRVQGPLLQTIEGLEAASRDLRGWMINEPPETAEMAERTASAGLDAAKRARAVLIRIAEPLEHLGGALREPAEIEQLFQQALDLVANTLDGWWRILESWNVTINDERWEQRQSLEGFIQNLPVLPTEALGEDTSTWTALRAAQQRWRNSGLFGQGVDMAPETEDALSRFQKEPI
jgi:hypothetical protein